MGKTKIETHYSGLSAGAVANLFGIGGEFKGGGFKPTDALGGFQGQFAPTLFTPEKYQEIIDYINRDPSETELGQLAMGDIASPERLGQGFQDYLGTAGSLSAALSEGLETGFETDIAPLTDYYTRQFQKETVPQLAEEFAGTTGLGSSDFGLGLLGAGKDLAVELGGLEFGAKEAAAGRQLEMVGMAPDIQASLLGAPMGYAADMLALGEATQPGRKAWESFLTLSGVGTGGQTVVKQPSNKTAQLMSAIGGLAGGIFGKD